MWFPQANRRPRIHSARVLVASGIAGSLWMVTTLSCAPAGSHDLASSPHSSDVAYREVSESEIRDRVRGAWLGQMIGVTWGFPTEFYARYIWQLFPELHIADGIPANVYAVYEGGPIPLDRLPQWSPSMINGGFTQDDLYVEVPFMEALAEHGVNAHWDRLANAFRESKFPLYHANLASRDNLRSGIDAPDSGHYNHNSHADDIDWQIEADFVGLMTPGLPSSAADIAFRTGHIMNYGDGVHGGVFVATLISTAFVAGSVEEIARAGVHAVPLGTQYRQVLDEIWADWADGAPYSQVLTGLYQRWGDVDRCSEWFGKDDPLNIDAKLNGAFILLGLLYGQGDISESMRYAMAAGQDSDCNPANVGSVLGAYHGEQGLREDHVDWLSALDRSQRFETTAHTLDDLVELNIELARQVVIMRGGRAKPGGEWSIPIDRQTAPVIAEQWPEIDNDAPNLTVTTQVRGDTVVVHASASDANGIAGYHCFFGDLTHAPGGDVEHRYLTPGSYKIIVFVIDRTGNTSHKIVTVQVH